MNKKIIFLFAFVAAAMNASASPITYQFSGVVTQVPIDDVYGDIAVGTLFEGSYTFNPAALDLIPADPASGSYTSLGVPFDMLVTVGGHSFSATDSINIGILNGFVDQYTVLGQGAGGNLALELFLQDNAASVLANDGLPLTVPLLAAFTIKDFHLHQVTTGGEVQLDGQLTSSDSTSVPEPSPAIPVGIVLAVIAVLGRRISVQSQTTKEK